MAVKVCQAELYLMCVDPGTAFDTDVKFWDASINSWHPHFNSIDMGGR